MADDRLRDLERRWKKTDRLEDEIPYLRERVRQGELAVSNLEIAALCGHPAAQIILNGEISADNRDLQEWLQAIIQVSDDTFDIMLRILLLLAVDLYPECLSNQYLLNIGRYTIWRPTYVPQDAVRTAIQWYFCPSEQLKEDAELISSELNRLELHLTEFDPALELAQQVIRSLNRAVTLISHPDSSDEIFFQGMLDAAGSTTLRDYPEALESPHWDRFTHLAQEDMRHFILEHLKAWSLGIADAVLDFGRQYGFIEGREE
jgi:hypothetical protein